ncbi:MAG: hypothetical protein IT454_00525 [Planctomycetes bacterium]|nr:hypothetical protein [Planctomycetota bacterium]
MLVPGGLDAWLERRLAAARTQGERLASQRAAQALERAEAKLDAAREEAAAALARSSVQLAVEIARTLVRNEIDNGRMNLERIVRDSLAASGVGRGACSVHLHPLDAAQLANVKFRSGTAIEPDEAVARGDVHVVTPNGLLVREIPEALRAIHERLLGELS